MQDSTTDRLRVIQISDTHVSARHDCFAANVAALGAHVAACGADLIINTGDISMDGAGSPADLDAAAAWHATLGAPVLSVPGNHDVGDRADIRPDQVLDDTRLAAFRARAGADRWVHDAAGWRLIGLNAMLLGTGHAEEAAQYEWLREAVDCPARIALFLHKPLFIEAPDEPPRGYWTVPPEPRARLLGCIAGAAIGLIASGHLHAHRVRDFAATTHVWAPSAAFVVGEMQEELGGVRALGLVEHVFTPAGVTSHVLRPAGMDDLPIDPVAHILYPPAPALPA